MVTSVQQNRPCQLSLGVRLADEASFDNYYSYGNEAAFQEIKKLCIQEKSLLYLWGGPDTGRTHLLQASCIEAHCEGMTAVYLPLAELVRYSIDLLEGLEQYDLVCVDDVENLASSDVWEESFFHLFNRLQQNGKTLLLSANAPPKQLPIQLEDLKSRLSAALVFQLTILSDEHKLHALQLRAIHRGLYIGDEVGQFIISRCDRSMSSLFNLLEKLDNASLQARRKITIPFLKEILGW
ncbi:UNVERIFIED_CONTAM: hypothetical protein GTU68_008606 [Idotea baltica]|nr:hypothetical protein [Idotea baltica]